jgi:hypothetical protein
VIASPSTIRIFLAIRDNQPFPALTGSCEHHGSGRLVTIHNALRSLPPFARDGSKNAA